jgi:PAS domain S-box-containing protein
MKRKPPPIDPERIPERADARPTEALLKTGALQSAIFNSANFSSIATDAKGVIQIFNVGAERMLGYTAAEVVNQITPAEISDPQEVIARAKALSIELGTPITPGFEALVFKASRGIEDIYELTYIRKDGSRFGAVVSVTALRDAQNIIIGYLLIGTDNTARQQAEEALLKAGALQSAIFNSANFSSIATDAKGVIQIFNVGAERMLGYTAAEVMNKITPADISDPQEVIARAKALSIELGTPITPGFEALVFKASRGIEDIYELTYIRKDGSRFPAVVSVTALRDAHDTIIGYLLIGTDNTARKLVEAEQQRLDQRLRDQQFYTRSLIESNIDALMTTDPSGIITDVNKQMEALTGCTRDELIGAPFKSYFTDPERAEAGIKLALSEKKVTDYELTACARDGKKTEVSYNATTFYDRDRRLQGVFAAARDVTERKQADEELQRANAKLKAWAQALDSFAIVAETDTKGRITHANDPFCRISKYAREELLGKDHREVVNSGYHPKEFWKGMWSTIGRGQIWRGEIKNRAKDGAVYWVDTVIVPLLGADGRPETYLAIRFVTTERKMAEELQRASSLYARSLIEASLDPLVTISSEGKITDVNEASVQATGVLREQLIATDFSDYFTEPDKARAGLQKVFSEGFVRDYPLAIRHITSRITDVLYNASVYKDDRGKVLGVFAAARDVTELKRFEQTLRQKNIELEDSSRMKSEFLANMSHELRTPLNAIIGFSEVLRDGLVGELTDQQRGFIGDIFGSGNHLLSLINDILDLSKVEAGKMMLDLEPVQASSLLVSSLSIIREKAATRRIRLDLEADEELGSIQVDARKVKQIVYNLLSNAVKFTAEGGRVVLRASRVPRAQVGRLSGPWTGRSLPLADNGFEEFLEISVTDSGIGIAHEGLEHLFKPFSQIDTGLARRFEGTGLGLVMVKLLAELHGGAVAVQSAVGQGSCFTVWLPLQASDERASTSAVAPPALPIEGPAGARVALVVEDDFKSADLIRVQLEAEGFRVLHAASAEAALVLAVQQPLALITLDIMLPNMDGWELLGRLEQVPDLRRIPIVIVSITADRQRGFALGAAAVMQKPLSRQELYDSLVDLGVLPLSVGQTLKVLVVDDDPKAVELIATSVLSLASTVLRAYGGREAIEIARRELPDVIVLDLMMPEVSGFDVVEALKEHPDTARMPILVITAKRITTEDRDRLSGYVTTIMEKAEFDGERFTAEVRRAMSGRQVDV